MLVPKFAIFSLLLSLGVSAMSQERKSNSYEFFVLTAGVYNNINLGFGKQIEDRREHLFMASSNLVLVFVPMFNLNLTYNYNLYNQAGKVYIPLWARLSNTRRDVGYEEGYFPSTLHLAVGTGGGTKVMISDRFGIRTEMGMGLMVRMENDNNGDVVTHRLDLTNYTFRRNRREWYDPFMIALKFRVTFLIRSGLSH